MARWTIYDKNGNVKAITSGITVGSRTLPELEYSGTWMGETFVTISVKSELPVDWQIGDYLIYRGEKFVLNYDPSVIKKARRNTYGEGFVYDSIKFNSLNVEMSDVQFLDEVLSDSHIHYTSLPDFSFFAATIDDYADRLQANMNRYCLQNNFLLSEWWMILTPSRERTVARGAGVSGLSTRLGAAWDAAYQDDPSTDGEKFNQNVSISKSTVFAGLANIYNLFGLHYVTSGRTLIIGAAGKIASHVFEYGKGNGLYEIERVADSEQQIVTKLYAYGNSTNLPTRYYANIAKVCVGKVTWLQKGGSTRLYIHTDVPYKDMYFTNRTGGHSPSALVKIKSHGVTIDGGVIDVQESLNGNPVQHVVQVDVFLKTSPSDPDWYTTDSEGLATLIQQIQDGDEIVFAEGADIDKWPAGHFSYINDDTVIPNNLAVNNLMLPGFPTQSLKDWVLANGGTLNQDGTVTWKGHTAYFSDDALAPYILSPNSSALGVREASKTWDGSDDTEDIYPTIENTNKGVIMHADIITDNGVFPEGDIPNFHAIVPALSENSLQSLLGDSDGATISIKDGYCGGREFKVVNSETIQDGIYAGMWELTLNRALEESLQIYFPYSNNASIAQTPVANEAYQLRGADIAGYDGDKFVWLGIDMPSEYVEASAEKLLDAALTFLETNDYTRYTYSPKVDEIYMAKQHDAAIASQSTPNTFDSLHDTLHEGNLIQFGDEDLQIDGNIFLDKLTIKEYGNGAIPTYDVTLRNHKSVGSYQRVMNVVDSLSSKGTAAGISGVAGLSISQAKDLIKQEGDKRFIRRDVNDETDTELTANKFIAKQGVVTDVLSEKTVGEGVTIPNDAIVDGEATINNDLHVTGEAQIQGDAIVDGDAWIEGDTMNIGSLQVQVRASAGTPVDGIVMGADSGAAAYEKDTKGCKIWWNGSGWMIETDYLSVNKRMYAKEVQVDEVTHVGGEQLLTDAACVADVVIPYKSDGSQAQSGDAVAYYRVFFRSKDSDGKTVYNRWRVGDQAYCQTFNIDKGITQDFTNRYYWRLVVRRDGYPQGGTFDDDTTALLADHHFIDISNIVYDESGANQMDGHATSVPSSEDNIVQLGHRGTWYIGNVLYQSELYGDTSALIERQGATLVSGGGKRGRAIVMWEGIHDFTLSTPRVLISPQAVRMTLDELKIKVTGGETKEIAEYVTDNQPSFEIFQLPTNAVPTTSNEPFTTWTSAEKEKYSTPPNNAVVLNSDGRTWRFEKNNGVYVFVEFTDPWLLAQHFKIEDILDDNVITADELLQLQDWWKAMIVGEGVDFEISSQYESFGQNPPAEVDDAWEEYDAASQVIGQSSTGVYYTYIFSPNVTAPIYLQGYDGEQSVTIPDDMPTRANLQAAIDNYNFAITKWQGVYALYKAKAEAASAAAAERTYVNGQIYTITNTTIDQHIKTMIDTFVGGSASADYQAALSNVASKGIAITTNTTNISNEVNRAQDAESNLQSGINNNSTSIAGIKGQGYTNETLVGLHSDLQATNTGITAVNNWMAIDVSGATVTPKQTFGASGLVTELDKLFLGVEAVTFDPNGNITNINKSGLVATSDFASLFAQEVTGEGIATTASVSTMIEDGISQASISADQVFIESGDKKLDNYFRLESGDVIMHDLFANNITVEGVINNEVIKLYNPEDEEQHEEGEAYNLEDFFFKSKNQFDFSDPKAYLFDPLSIGTYIECATLLHSIDLYFPCLLWDNNNAKYVIYGVTKDGTHYTLGHLRQCIGKKFYINLGSGVTGGPTCRLFTGSTSGTVNMFVSNAYADTTNLDGEVSPLKWRADFSNTVEQSGGLHFVLLECKAGQKNGHYCIYWEVVCKYGVFYFDDETEEGCAADISQE